MLKKEPDIIQRKLLELIRTEQYEGMTLREIQSAIGVDYPQAIFNKLQQLENKGFIRKDANGQFHILENPIEQVSFFPLIGVAQCWNLWPSVDIDEQQYEKIAFPTKLLPIKGSKSGYVFVKAKWKSMEPLVGENDLLFVRLQDDWTENEMVLILHEGKPKIKRIHRSDGKVFLVSDNRDYVSREILPEDTVRIIGSVKKIISNP